MIYRLLYIVCILILFTACETLYDPALADAEDLLVVDARLVFGETEHMVFLSKSRGFNDPDKSEPFTNASVLLIDSNELRFPAVQIQSGVYRITTPLDASKQYRLQIVSAGDTIISEFEPVQDEPSVDSIYSEAFELWSQPGGENDTESFQKYHGHQVYVNVDNQGTKRYYLFDTRSVLLYHFPFDTVLGERAETVIKYGWKSIYPDDLFNIAAPPLYTQDANILKHPVGFFRYNSNDYLSVLEAARGWICLLYQYAISESAWNFYRDLNSQLGSEGKIFDPLYVQARGNVKCINNPQKPILGNFEISRMREHRFYIRFEPISGNHVLRKVDQDVPIPESGQSAIYPPPFWEN